MSAFPDDISQAARKAAEDSARAQGLPPRITDAIALQRVAVILRTPSTRNRTRSGAGTTGEELAA